MNYINAKLKKFTDDLASHRPAPGGGSAAALTAVTGVSLFIMVGNYTKDKKEYAPIRKKVISMMKLFSSMKLKLEKLIDEDVRVYNELSKCLKMSGSKPGRKRFLKKALKEASRVPFNVCRITCDILQRSVEVAENWNSNLVTDSACGAFLLEAAFNAALMNVLINLKFLDDSDFKKRMNNELIKMNQEIGRMEKGLVRIIDKKLI